MLLVLIYIKSALLATGPAIVSSLFKDTEYYYSKVNGFPITAVNLVSA